MVSSEKVSPEKNLTAKTSRTQSANPVENFLETVQTRDVQNGDFQVIVGGYAYGSGSSREVAVVAHRGAGIELVVDGGVTCGVA